MKGKNSTLHIFEIVYIAIKLHKIVLMMSALPENKKPLADEI
jgi:hypothetical protein